MGGNLKKDMVHKSKTKAKAEADLVQAKDDKEAVLLELEQLGNYKAELHGSCLAIFGGALFFSYRHLASLSKS
jgi:hypothetical protein